MKSIKKFSAEPRDVWVWIEHFGDKKRGGEVMTEHRHDFYEFLFFAEGEGLHLVDFVKYQIKPNSCYVIFPNQIHLLKDFANLKGCIVRCFGEGIFSKELNALLLNQFFSPQNSIVFENNPAKFAETMQMFQSLKFVLEKYPNTTNNIILHTFQAFLLCLLDIAEVSPESGNKSNDAKLIVRFLQLVEQHFSTAHTVKEYAELLQTSERKISSATQHHLELNPLQVIHNRILLEAKRLMIYENISQKEIAFKLGFVSSDSYSHFVKSKTGATPTELKDKIVKIHKF